MKLAWEVEVTDDSSEIICNSQADKPRVPITVLNAHSEPLSGVWVTINHHQPALETDDHGVVVVPVVSTPNTLADDDVAVEWIEVASDPWFPRQEVPSGYWSHGQAVDCQGYNSFTVILDLEPDTQHQELIQTYRAENESLLLLSSYDPYVQESQYFAKQLQKDTTSE